MLSISVSVGFAIPSSSASFLAARSPRATSASSHVLLAIFFPKQMLEIGYYAFQVLPRSMFEVLEVHLRLSLRWRLRSEIRDSLSEFRFGTLRATCRETLQRSLPLDSGSCKAFDFFPLFRRFDESHG